MEPGMLRLSGLAFTSLAVASALVLGGCSARRSGGYYDSELPGEGGVSEDALAGQPSIEQFEEVGKVLPGGAFKDISFAFDSDRLDLAAQDAISHDAAILEADSKRKIEIEGHCDERGSSEYNLALGARRARAVKEALVAAGIASDRMSTVSYGEELPLCKAQTDECWASNRRAHLVDLMR
ncbi:MAG: peptidoglycan-associated lipoprotein Pal [Candidatus Binatia bacterium]